jgi:hypothetical protein
MKNIIDKTIVSTLSLTITLAIIIVINVSGITIEDEIIPLSDVSVVEYHIKDEIFGVKGDGIQNDTVAFNKAINSLNDGDTLIIDKGNYMLDILNIYKDNINIIGEQGSVIICANEIHTFANIKGKNILISGIEFNGNYNALRVLSILSNSSEIELNKCIVRNVFNDGKRVEISGIRVYGDCNNITIDSCEISNISSTTNNIMGDSLGASRGILVSPYVEVGQGNSYNITIKNCKIDNIGPREDGDGIVISSIGALKDNEHVSSIINNKLTNCSKRAIKVMGSNVNIEGNTIINTFEGAKKDWTDGMYSAISAYGSDIEVVDNIITGTSFYIPLDFEGKDLSNITVRNNHISVGEGGAVLPYKGTISFNGSFSNVEVIENNISNGNIGIYFRKECSEAIITDNTINNSIENKLSYGVMFDDYQYILFEEIEIGNNEILSPVEYYLGKGLNFELNDETAIVVQESIKGNADYNKD